jgi:phosphoglycolate phosphatase
VTEPVALRPPPLNPARVRGLIFDLDGTLVDSYVAITASLNHARAAWALPPMEACDVRRHVGRGLEALIADLVGADRVERGVRLFRERYAEVYAEGTIVLDHVGPALRTLEEGGLRLAVASNKPARFTRPILDALGLAGHFRSIEGPDLAGTTKPEPTMLRRSLAALQLVPAEAAYVGDMVLDVETAARAEVPVILVPGGSSLRDDLERTGQTLLDSFGDLPALLLRSREASGDPP